MGLWPRKSQVLDLTPSAKYATIPPSDKVLVRNLLKVNKMLLSDGEILSRASSPNNLINRLKKELAFKPAVVVSIPPPKAEDIVEDLDTKIADANLTIKARAVLDLALDELRANIGNVKADKLSTIAKDMGFGS